MAARILILLIFLGSVAWAQTSPHGNIRLECQTCHTTASWEMSPDASFNHDKLKFPLSGQHKSVDCASCHAGLRFDPIDTDCASCHADIHRNELGAECARCHTTQSWLVPDMNQRHQETQFPLLGRHATADCQSCHPGSAERRFAGTPITCSGCHMADFKATTSPNHMAAGFSTDCEQCHAVTAFSWSQGFDHNLTAFPLTGSHTTIACTQCHTNSVFAGTPIECVACHQPDYDQTRNPNHVSAGFPTDCAICHSTTGWEGAPFDHNQTGFPLTGEHVDLDCQSCHGDGVYAAKLTDCFTCHEGDFISVQNPGHTGPGFTTDCLTCHTTGGWQPAGFDHAVTVFPLTGAHTGESCQSCHINSNFQIVFTDCYQCHQSDFASVQDPNHVVENFSHDCTPCHSTVSWEPASFDHNATAFPLTGVHIGVDCQSCHVNGNYQITYSDCYQCHQTEFQSVTDPNHVAGNFSHDCQPCHTTTAWTPASFDHSGTSFALTGAHVITECQSCHINGNYQITYIDCYQCHQADFQVVVDPNHVAGNFSHDCQPCHSTNSWVPATFDHTTTAFPLTGAHVTTQCQSCHVNGNYQITYTDCYQCHQGDFTSVQNPNHVTGNFGHDCTPCHSTSSWEPATFDHNVTAFPLTGAHNTADCQSCHISGNYQLSYTDCYQCHQVDFQAVVDPNHVTGNFGHDCQPCHTTTAWLPATFDHATTAFPLTGAHVTTQCQSCHVNGNYQLAYTDCYQCHESEFQAAIEPNHVAGNFGHDCQPCHTTVAWEPATFDHNVTTFPLTGAHVTVECQSCHINGNYLITYTDCYQCHDTEYQAVLDPNHVAGNFRHDCQPCHTTTGWLPATFDHSGTSFPLTGAHVTADCQSCHINGNYQLSYTDCFQCHDTEFQAVLDPNHVTGNFSHDCQPCHTTTAWLPATFDHNTTTFPLTGAHVTTDCQSCHVNGNYQLTYTDCYQCHDTDFQAVLDPNHVAGNFSHDCQPCHSTTAWVPATFDHGTTAFPLTGAHTTTPCQSCHINGNYQLTFTDCFQCHEPEYQGVLEPNHAAGNFGHDCTPCHATTAWLPSTFDHNTTTFPLTGEHQAVTCSDCHVNNQYQGTPTDCYACHEADYTSTTNPNHVAGGFPTECLECHTTTAWSPATFDHNTTSFPLTGAHVTTDCQSCHINGNYQLVYDDCYQCHETEYQQPTDPNHVALQFSHDCTPCHTTTAWFPSTFDHDTQYFRIYSGAHREAWSACSDCHPNPGNYAEFTCISCHEHNQPDMDDKHSEVQGYVYASPACYDCHSGAALQ